MAAACWIWADAPPPPEAVDLYLCRTYNCLPSALDDEDYERIARHMIIMDAEAKARTSKRL